MHLETQLVGSAFILDTGTYTADAIKQPDGSWEVHGAGWEALLGFRVEDAELTTRKVAFLPKQAFKKAQRAANLQIKRTGTCVLSDGTVFCCSSLLKGTAA